MNSFTLKGSEVVDLVVEVTVSNRGIPRVDVAGVRGSGWLKDIKKIRAAFGNSDMPFPNKKITISVSPPDVLEKFSEIGFAICTGIICTQHSVKLMQGDFFCGGVESSGRLVPFHKTIFLDSKWQTGKRGRIFLSPGSYFINYGSGELKFYEIGTLSGVLGLVTEDSGLTETKRHLMAYKESLLKYGEVGFNSILGNISAKRALTIAVSGFHNILLLGPSGTGKSILAHQCAGLIENMADGIMIDRLKAAVLCGIPVETCIRTPFRNPHITVKEADMIGSSTKPGEATLAHGGILFLDEMHLFPAKILNSFKTIIDNRGVEFVSGGFPVKYPADFLLIGAANNCMCGLAGSTEKQCKCTGGDINLYNSRLNPSLLERFDLLTYVMGSPAEAAETREKVAVAGSTDGVRKSIRQAFEIQKNREVKTGVLYNSRIPFDLIDSVCTLDKDATALLGVAVSRLDLSTRSVHRIKAVSRTIADLDGEEYIHPEHVAEAIQYRVKNDKP